MESATPHPGGRFSVLTIFLATKRNLSGTGLRLYLCARSGLLTYNPKLAGERMNEASPAAQAAMLSELLGGVLSYTTTGHRRVCGNAIGANGCGDFCIVFLGDREQAETKARDYLRNMEKNGYKITTAIFVPNDELGGYGGNPLRIDA